MPIDFDLANKFILLTAPDTSVDLQTLGNATRDFEETFPAMSDEKIIDWFGKQSLGGGKLVGITLVLLNGWKIKADDRAGPTVTLITITGGNLVGDVADPVEASTFVAYVIEQDTSAALLSAATLEANLLTAIDHQAGNRRIDFTGDDALGWQEVVYEFGDPLTEVGRYNLYDEADVRITGSVSGFVAAGKMIARREST